MNNSVVCKESFLFFKKGKEYQIKDYTEYHPGKLSSLCLRLSDNLSWWVTDEELDFYFLCDLNQMRKVKLDNIHRRNLVRNKIKRN